MARLQRATRIAHSTPPSHAPPVCSGARPLAHRFETRRRARPRPLAGRAAAPATPFWSSAGRLLTNLTALVFVVIRSLVTALAKNGPG
jgi:hypothetical protein